MVPRRPVHFRNLLAACCILAGASLLGCARMVSTPFVEQTPFVDQGRFQPSFNMLYEDPDAASMREKTLLVHVDDPRQTLYPEYSKVSPDINWDVRRSNFENYIANVLWRSRVFSDVSATSDTRPLTRPDLTLEVALVRWDEGSKWPRFIIGFGLGATRVQWEGKITDNSTGRMLLAFADARLHPGGPSATGPNLKALKGWALIDEDLSAGCEELANIARRVTQTTETPYPRYRRHPIYRTASDPVIPPMSEDAPTTGGCPAIGCD